MEINISVLFYFKIVFFSLIYIGCASQQITLYTTYSEIEAVRFNLLPYK